MLQYRARATFIPVFLLLSLIPGAYLAAQSSPMGMDFHSIQENFTAHYSAIQSFGPRNEASNSADEVFEYLRKFAVNLDISHRSSEIRRSESFHSYGRNISLVIPGTENNDIIVFVPYVTLNESPKNSQDNSGAIAAVLAMIQESVQKNVPPASNLEIYFIGSVDEDKGVREYLSSNTPDIPQAVMYLDSSQGVPSRAELINGDNGGVSPLWLVRHGIQSLENNNLDNSLPNNRSQLFRIGLARPGEIGPLLTAQLNSIHIRLHGKERVTSSEHIFAFLKDMIWDLGNDIISTNADIGGSWDQHYLNFSLGGKNLIVPERQYVLSVVSLLLLLQFWLVLFRRRRDKYFRTLGKNFWNLPLLFAGMFLFVFLGSLMVAVVEAIRGIEDLWQHMPIPLLGLKILTAGALFSIFFALMRKLPLSRNGSFYSASAIMILSADVVIFGIVNITYSYYFLWALFWSFFFSISNNRIIKLICAILSPLLLIISFADVILLNELLLIREIVSMSPGINLLTAFIVLPFMLMLIRLDFLFPHPVRGKAKNRGNFTLRYTALFMLALVLINLIVTFAIKPFSPELPQTVVISSNVVQETQWEGRQDVNEKPGKTNGSINAFSQARIGDFSLNFDGVEISAEKAGKTITYPLRELNRRLSYTMESQSFLGRTSYRMEIISSSPAQNIRVSMQTGQDISVYDSNLPYRSLTGRGEIRFLSGINPPNPMVLEFTLPASARPQIQIDARYLLNGDLRLTEEDTRRFRLMANETLILTPGDNREDDA